MRKSSLFALAALLALSSSSPAAAAILLVDGVHGLYGATGVVIGSSTYDVELLDGTCAGLFNGCDSASDFTFQSQNDAKAAAQALLDQVFLNIAEADFVDTDYGHTEGCSPNFFEGNACFTLIPYATSGGSFTAQAARNDNTISAGDNVDLTVSDSVDFDTFPALQFVWARFTPSATAVPEPATWAMMLLGFGAIGASFCFRHRRKGRAAYLSN